jgi:hypothetical protein
MLHVLASAFAALVLDVKMPLAADAGDVARRLQSLRQSDDFAAHRDAVVLDAEAVLIPPGHQPGPRRRTLRRGDVAVGETHPVRGEAVHVRRADVFVDAVRPEVSPTVVVGEDDKDVRFRRLGGVSRTQSREDAKENDAQRILWSAVTCHRF